MIKKYLKNEFAHYHHPCSGLEAEAHFTKKTLAE